MTLAALSKDESWSMSVIRPTYYYVLGFDSNVGYLTLAFLCAYFKRVSYFLILTSAALGYSRVCLKLLPILEYPILKAFSISPFPLNGREVSTKFQSNLSLSRSQGCSF